MEPAAPDSGHGKTLYLQHCRACHGGHAWGDGPRAIPALAGQREKYLVAQLTLFADDKRAGQSMHEIMQRPDVDRARAIRDLAAYLSSAPRSPGPEYESSHDMPDGMRLYRSACKDCHGSEGEGTEAGVPAIGGQQYRYLAGQLGNFAHGHRDAGDLGVVVSMGALSARDIHALANYTAQLSYLTAAGAQAATAPAMKPQ